MKKSWGSIHVADYGSKEAWILLVGEAPGSNEVTDGEPFVGSSGNILAKWWKDVGMQRAHFYITNLFPFQPAHNKIGTVPEEELQKWVPALHRKISEMPNLRVIVPTGGTALRALKRVKLHGREFLIMDWRGSIMEYEGGEGRKIKMIPTLHPATTLGKRKLEYRCREDWKKIRREVETPVITIPRRNHRINPTIQDVREFFTILQKIPTAVDIETHPKEGITCVGFAQSATESFTIPVGTRRTLRVPAKRKNVSKVEKEEWQKEVARRVVEAIHSPFKPLVEFGKRTKKGEISKSITNALSKFQKDFKLTPTIKKLLAEWEKEHGVDPIPEPTPSEWDFLTVGYWKSDEENREVCALLREFCEGDIPKIFQNGLYDTFWLVDWLGARTVNRWDWDTMSMHHCLFPRDEHSLDYMASIFTNEPFWKNEAKEASESGKFTKRGDALYTYNGKDCALTWELYDVFRGMLEEKGKLEFYLRHYHALQEPLLAIMLRGMTVDMGEVEKASQAASQAVETAVRDIEEITGVNLKGKKKISAQKLKNFMYRELGLPTKLLKRPTGEKTETANEIAVRDLVVKCQDWIERAPTGARAESSRIFLKVAPMILTANREAKVVEQLLPRRFESGDIFRSSYKFTTSTGRLASSSNPYGAGSNAQNLDRNLRGIFRAPPGYFYMEIDLSQAEGRDVYMRTRDPRLVQMAQTHPADYDMHRAEASEIFSNALGRYIPPEEVTDQQRSLGKKTVHGAQRDMRGPRMSEQLLKEGVIYSARGCDALLEAYHGGKPAIRQVYFRETREEIWNTKSLTNLWGREIHFLFDRWDKELYREGYSFKPQSDIADLLNQWGLVPVHHYIQSYNLMTRIVAQVHDALWFLAHPADAWWVAEAMRASIERPIDYFGNSLVMPCTLKIGKTAKGSHEWKRFPSLDEFNEKVKEVIGEN